MNSHPLARWASEDVVTEVFAALDVILVVVGPVQLDFFPLVGNGVDAFLVPAQRDEVALVVVAAEEVVTGG